MSYEASPLLLQELRLYSSIVGNTTIRKKIDEGLKDAKEGRVIPIEDLMKARKGKRRAKV